MLTEAEKKTIEKVLGYDIPTEDEKSWYFLGLHVPKNVEIVVRSKSGTAYWGSITKVSDRHLFLMQLVQEYNIKKEIRIAIDLSQIEAILQTTCI